MGCDIHAHIERKRRIGGCFWVDKGDAEIGRHYEMFALLAGVRNYEVWKPVAEPKGLPDDVTTAFGAYSESYGSDGHSHSWLTLAELKAADLEQERECNDVILSKDAQGNITATAGWVAPGIPTLGRVGKIKPFQTFGRKAWDDLLARMEAIKLEGQSDEDVRLVFFFDN